MGKIGVWLREQPGKETLRMKYRIVYDSRTGNTQRVAGAIEKGLAAYTGAVCRIEEALEQGPDPETDVYFVGFWNDKGTCSEGVQAFLSRLHGTQAALFGTCGMGSSGAYFRQVEERVKALLPEDCGYLGACLCAGRMPPQVLERYRKMQQQEDSPRIRMMIRAYEDGQSHPDEADLAQAAAFAAAAMERALAGKPNEKP